LCRLCCSVSFSLCHLGKEQPLQFLHQVHLVADGCVGNCYYALAARHSEVKHDHPRAEEKVSSLAYVIDAYQFRIDGMRLG